MGDIHGQNWRCSCGNRFANLSAVKNGMRYLKLKDIIGKVCCDWMKEQIKKHRIIIEYNNLRFEGKIIKNCLNCNEELING